MSEAEINKEDLIVSDICKMEGDNINLISNLVISPELYKDSIVDNRELYDFLSLSLDKKLFIFGSGVKIKKNIVKKEIESEKTILVEKGMSVELSIKKNGITIEMKGRALNRGCEKDEIDFRLSTGKVVKGKIISERKADVIL
ncbi:MAG TPA: flagella basal body P-ring formation protein FlgA [Spirochaetota bacterium]|nr:flagella basal body P-ring formation protein FlgA [Spirochaetota bacterium]HPS85612.1 flagella basal body P-ring formation protein FlgA [Spirochaetota bacterium]